VREGEVSLGVTLGDMSKLLQEYLYSTGGRLFVLAITQY
jgi:hypothetical protein